MENLKRALKKSLKGSRRIAVLGIGSDLRSDDAAGMLVALEVEKRLKKSDGIARKIRVYFGATAPENLTGEIKRFKPTHIVIIDTAEIGEAPGTILVLTPDAVGDGVSFSTHSMPAKIMVEYFVKSFKCAIIIVGIQPKSVKFGERVSPAVRASARDVADAIVDAI